MSFSPSHSVKAILGPTNTGKTYFAIERMLAHPTGMIGLPLRLLAREVYQRVVERVGEQAVALITGEERIVPAKLLGGDGRSHAHGHPCRLRGGGRNPDRYRL